jgi:methionyl-tRNA formyltransferase
MRLVFAGTPEFAARALAALIGAGHEIVLVLTQPDRPAGRGMKLKASPVKELALAHGLAVAQPENLKTPQSRQAIVDAGPEVMVVAAYGLILPQSALDIPRLGCVNIHASLLPRWRGAAPIQRAIEAGDGETGITLMQMDRGLDTGAMLRRYPLAIGREDTAGSLHDKLAELGASAIVELLPELETTSAVPQDDRQATYAAKIGKDEARIDWTLPADVLGRRIRAFNPFPGAVTQFQGEPLKIWLAQPAPGQGVAGEVLSVAPLRVACGEDALELLEVQRAGGKRLPAAAYVAGNAVTAGLRMT